MFLLLMLTVFHLYNYRLTQLVIIGIHFSLWNLGFLVLSFNAFSIGGCLWANYGLGYWVYSLFKVVSIPEELYLFRLKFKITF